MDMLNAVKEMQLFLQEFFPIGQAKMITENNS